MVSVLQELDKAVLAKRHSGLPRETRCAQTDLTTCTDMAKYTWRLLDPCELLCLEPGPAPPGNTPYLGPLPGTVAL